MSRAPFGPTLAPLPPAPGAPPFAVDPSSPPAWPAPAKVNLCLHVTGRRADGYHQLQTLFQFLDFGDSVRLVPRADGRVRLLTPTGGWPPETDLAVRAARALREAAGRAELGVDLAIDKRVPAGSGLGGGSSDAATTLVVLNRLWGLHLPTARLAALGQGLGADVPVFVHGQAAWAEGVGEALTPVAPPERALVLLVPPVAVPTAAVFGAPDLPREAVPVDAADVLAGRVDPGNACEAVACRLFPPVGEALARLADAGPGALGPPRISGTGASTFRMYADRPAARAAAARVAATLPAGWLCRVAHTQNTSALRLAIIAGAPEPPRQGPEDD